MLAVDVGTALEWILLVFIELSPFSGFIYDSFLSIDWNLIILYLDFSKAIIGSYFSWSLLTSWYIL